MSAGTTLPSHPREKIDPTDRTVPLTPGIMQSLTTPANPPASPLSLLQTTIWTLRI